MTLIFLIGFAICFSFGLVLSGVLMYIDIRGQTKHGPLGHDYRWGRALALLFDALQMCLSIAQIVNAVAVFHHIREGCSWLEIGVVCSLHLAVGTNVRTSESFI